MCWRGGQLSWVSLRWPVVASSGTRRRGHCIIELATHWRFRRAGAGAQREWALILAGLAALAFSGLMLLPADSRPIAAAPLIGLFAVVFGYLHLRAGLSLGGLAHGMLRADEQPASLSTELAGPKERTP